MLGRKFFDKNTSLTSILPINMISIYSTSLCALPALIARHTSNLKESYLIAITREEIPTTTTKRFTLKHSNVLENCSFDLRISETER
jgi:hypothetical protein